MDKFVLVKRGVPRFAPCSYSSDRLAVSDDKLILFEHLVSSANRRVSAVAVLEGRSLM